MATHSGHTGHLPSSGRALVISGWLTGIYFIVEIFVGLWTVSVAVISDAFHTFSAVRGVLVALIAARRPGPDARADLPGSAYFETSPNSHHITPAGSMVLPEMSCGSGA